MVTCPGRHCVSSVGVSTAAPMAIAAPNISARWAVHTGQDPRNAHPSAGLCLQMPSKDGEPQTWRETLSLKSTKSEVHRCEFVTCLGFLDRFSRQDLLLREGVPEPYRRRQLLGGLPSAQSKQRERRASYGLREDRAGRGLVQGRQSTGCLLPRQAHTKHSDPRRAGLTTGVPHTAAGTGEAGGGPGHMQQWGASRGRWWGLLPVWLEWIYPGRVCIQELSLRGVR